MFLPEECQGWGRTELDTTGSDSAAVAAGQGREWGGGKSNCLLKDLTFLLGGQKCLKLLLL